MGLITGHAYSITAVKMVDIQTSRTQGQIPLGKCSHIYYYYYYFFLTD